MEEAKTSEAQAPSSFTPGLELEDLEILSSTLSIFYESAKRKFRDLKGNSKKAKKNLLNQDGPSKQKSKQEIEQEVAEDYMVKHVREMIHRVGSFDRFRKIVKRAITTENTGKSFEKLKTMPGGRDIRTGDQITTASQIAAPSAQPDTMIALQNMMKKIKYDVEKKMFGKDPENNIYKAISQSKENIGGAIA
jgi:hypothetical protein